MTETTRNERIETADGGFDAYVALPDAGSGPGMLLIHEIFGVNDYVEDAARRLAVQDAIVALGALRELPEVAAAGGRAGVLGFCLGGTLAYQVAAHAEPDVAVCYYGSGIPGALDAAASISCPTLMHWGGADRYTPRELIDAVASMAAGRENFECHVHEGAGHAFDNSFAPRFSDPPAAARAWELTTAFLERTLPAS